MVLTMSSSTSPEATTSPSRSPILGLRLKTSSQRKRRSHRQLSVDDEELLIDQARLLHSQDLNSYKCNDYLARRKEQQQQQQQQKNNDDGDRMIIEDDDDNNDSNNNMITEETVDAVCREKMCEWSYRVCDHFHAPRDVVAISYSYLDRFLDRCDVDRKTFKLAAMTTLYMANKTCGVVASSSSSSSAPVMSIRTLANLSRGEFEMSHIAEMETILLSTLGWKVNPPTVQAFVDAMLSVLPVTTTTMTKGNTHHHHHHHDMIYQRAIFFAELAVYDYTLVTKERALLALASILNAMEGMNLPIQEFCDAVYATFGFEYPFDVVETCRNRLWYIYGNTAQYRDEERRLMLDTAGHHDYHNKAAPAGSFAAYNKSMSPSQQQHRIPSHPRSPVSVAVVGDE